METPREKNVMPPGRRRVEIKNFVPSGRPTTRNRFWRSDHGSIALVYRRRLELTKAESRLLSTQVTR